ncbi:hypothetical protein BGX21_005250 [Mortierella sp. AD011]|nr:hypothetical protein BGX20_005290 [Mortierella sp. AD010]KAF9399962.1 hypothetical protein BGX21_005250 [Mortierella sp. AD011]
MRPDPHKQAASRKYHNKVRSRGGGTSGATADPSTGSTGHRGGRGGRGGGGGRGGYRGRSSGGKEEDPESDGEDSESAPRKSYARRKIVSNADRYVEKEEVDEAEELEQGIDRQTLAFKEMLKDSDQKKTFDPAAYFRFKSEKEVEAQDPQEESQQSRKLLEIRLDDIERSLITIPIKDRLYLRDSDVKALERDIIGKVSLSTGKPIIPKLVRGQAASDILIKPSANLAGAATSSANVSTTHSNVSMEPASMDDDLDELLDITKTYGRARLSNSTSQPTPSKAVSSSNVSTPSPIATKSQESTLSSGSKVRLPPIPRGNRTTDVSGDTTPKVLKKGLPRATGKKDEEWLDSVLGI